MKDVDIKKELHKLSNSQKAEVLQVFFKTGKGEYAEGDRFYGIIVPVQRQLAKKYVDLSFGEIKKLLKGEFHEERLVACLILVEKYRKANKEKKRKIFEFYIENIQRINNWDLVDLSAPKICGAYLFENKNKKNILYELAKSDNLWKKRISIVTTFAFIKNGDFEDTLRISKMLLNDRHDLIHKAVGWMLREVGKRNQDIEEKFLKKYYQKMPRTMLRYAIERFDDQKRAYYMAK